MPTRLRFIGIIVLVAMLATACDIGGGPAPTAAPTATPWVIIVTATPSGPPTPGPSPTPGPTQPSAPTPTQIAPPSPTRVPPTPTFTPRPAPPQVFIQLPPNGSHFTMPNLVRVVVAGSGGAPLDRLELWGYPQGQGPQLYHTWPAGGRTSYTDEFGWPPPNPGTYLFFAYAYDVLGQRGQSAQITVYVDQPVAPTATPVPSGPSVQGNWGAEAGNGDQFLFVITGRQGNALQGTLTLTPPDSGAMTVPIFDSTIEGNNVTLHAMVGSVRYNFTLHLSSDGRTMSGTWVIANMGIPQPITFNRLLM